MNVHQKFLIPVDNVQLARKKGFKPSYNTIPCLLPVFLNKIMRRVSIFNITQSFRCLRIVRSKALVELSRKVRQHVGIFACRLRKQRRGKELVDVEMGAIGPGKLPFMTAIPSAQQVVPPPSDCACQVSAWPQRGDCARFPLTGTAVQLCLQCWHQKVQLRAPRAPGL